jgi:hypothetical protein
MDEINLVMCNLGGISMLMILIGKKISKNTHSNDIQFFLNNFLCNKNY